MKPLFFEGDDPQQRLTEAMFNLDEVKKAVHFFDRKNREFVYIVWKDGLEDTLDGINARNFWAALCPQPQEARRRS